MKKKIAELSPEQQEQVRAYNREQKKKSREKQRQAAYVPTADEWFDGYAEDCPEQNETLRVYCKQV